MTGPERPGRPVLVYDGDCGFCTSSVRFLERHVPVQATVVAFQFADLDALGTTAERAEYEVLWIDRAGRVSGGAEAVGRLLTAARRPLEGARGGHAHRAGELARARRVPPRGRQPPPDAGRDGGLHAAAAQRPGARD
ncbi:thiol-disulfide oxidoreductase DCC family protein [Actinomadura madurae]|uniref:thiol-disulfide oxidoreductase DCC family protein n=1 Tax=Actinomadura madurae TaxID=1993 RepID=UPI0020D24D03|nr:DCC1-like thiol-disulfide oxidoreductase family protein [Actinomadura madurae]MCQ0012368.1 DUF393 domain-containing protein [Actinomadura madurae]